MLPHGLHDPPQSTPVSPWFFIPSEHFITGHFSFNLSEYIKKEFSRKFVSYNSQVLLKSYLRTENDLYYT